MVVWYFLLFCLTESLKCKKKLWEIIMTKHNLYFIKQNQDPVSPVTVFWHKLYGRYVKLSVK